jgi:hypothetical protein
MMRAHIRRFPLILLTALTCVYAAQGRQQSQQPSQQQGGSPGGQSSEPIPAYHSPLASGADNGQDAGQSQTETPDNNSPSGAQGLSLGSIETRSYWQPNASIVATGDSDALGPQGGWTTYTSFVGGIDLHKLASHSDLTLSYLGGGSVSDDGAIGNYVFQELSATEKFHWRRYNLSFFDTLEYLPETAFGFGGLGVGGPSLPGGVTVGLQPGLTPQDSILSTRSQLIENSSFAQFDVNLTPRSSITLLAGYSLLDYFSNGLANSNDTILQAGYNHTIRRNDTLSVLYRFSDYRFPGNGQSIHDNVVQLNYSKRVTGRLAFQVGAGPEYTLFNTPILTSGSSTTKTSQLLWSLTSSLTYGLKRGALGLSYSHGVSGGSGILTGSVADTVAGTLTRQLTRTLNFGINSGYARNTALAIPGFGIAAQSYNYWFFGANVSHPFSRTLSLFASYQLQYQTSNFGFCIGTTCGSSFTRHLISVGVNWRGRPRLF